VSGFAALPASALGPDAPSAQARMREAELQRLRELARGGEPLGRPFALWTQAEVDALAWVARLASSGHWSARSLFDRIVGADGFSERYAGFEPGSPVAAQLSAAAAIETAIAKCFLGRARLEAWGKARSLDRVLAWLDLGGAATAPLAATLRAWAAEHGALSEGDWAQVSLHLGLPVGRWHTPRHDPGTHLREDLERARRREAERATLGARIADEKKWIAEHRDATDRVAHVRTWLESGGKPDTSGQWRAAVVGAALEKGALGAPADLAAALPWYAQIMGLDRLAAGGEAAIDQRACLAIANVVEQMGFDPDMAARWYERGIARGHPRCMALWLTACRAGKLGLGGRLADAVALARNFSAAGHVVASDMASLETGVLAEAKKELETSGALGASGPWVEILARLGSAECEIVLEVVRAGGGNAAKRVEEALERFKIDSQCARTLVMVAERLSRPIDQEADSMLRAALARVIERGQPEQRHRAQELLASFPAVTPAREIE
jgi:hypothetical protein